MDDYCVIVCFPVQLCLTLHLFPSFYCVCVSGQTRTDSLTQLRTNRVDLELNYLTKKDASPMQCKNPPYHTNNNASAHFSHFRRQVFHSQQLSCIFCLSHTQYYLSPSGGTPQRPWDPFRCQTLNMAFLGSYCYGYLQGTVVLAEGSRTRGIKILLCVFLWPLSVCMCMCIKELERGRERHCGYICTIGFCPWLRLIFISMFGTRIFWECPLGPLR